MPIYDINKNQIKQNPFCTSDCVQNIEIGAGKGFLGKVEYPECYTTDIRYPNDIKHFSQFQEYDEKTDCHYIDFLCNFESHNFLSKKFRNIVICNPYNFGYKSYYTGKVFFDQIGSILEDDGELTILCNKSNPWCNERSLREYFSQDVAKSNFKFTYSVKNQISERFQKYTFFQLDLKSETKINLEISIKLDRNDTR